MTKKFEEFDRSRLRLEPLADRKHDLTLESILPLKHVEVTHDAIKQTASKMISAKEQGSSIVLMIGAHVLRDGVQRYIIDLMERGFITSIAFNGAGLIHDYELSLIGATTESVARYIRTGQFGLWNETGRINEIAKHAAAEKTGFGEAAGEIILKGNFPHKDISLFAAAYRLGILSTIHVGIGYDIIHEHPNCDGAALGVASYTDFLRFAKVLDSLEGGVAMNFGSSVMGPEVYLKALSMVRNVALQEGRKIADFTVLVCDLKPLTEEYRSEPDKCQADYYFRPWKTMLVRTVADGGNSFYVKDRHSNTIPQLWSAINSIMDKGL